MHDLDRQCSNGGVFTAVVIVPFTENGHYVYTISNNSATFKTILCTQITYLFSKRQCCQLRFLIQKRGKLVKTKYVISTYRYQKYLGKICRVGNTVIERPIRTTPKVTSGNKDDLFLADFVADDDDEDEESWYPSQIGKRSGKLTSSPNEKE